MTPTSAPFLAMSSPRMDASTDASVRLQNNLRNKEQPVNEELNDSKSTSTAQR